MTHDDVSALMVLIGDSPMPCYDCGRGGTGAVWECRRCFRPVCSPCWGKRHFPAVGERSGNCSLPNLAAEWAALEAKPT